MKKILKTMSCLFLISACLCVVGYHAFPGFRLWVRETAANIEVPEEVQMLTSPTGSAIQNTDPAGDVQVHTLVEEEDLSGAIARGMMEFQSPIAISLRTSADEDHVLSLVDSALTRVRREYPNIFWMSMGEYRIRWTDQKTYIQFSLSVEYCHSRSETQRIAEEMEAVADRVVAEIPSGGYERAKYLHDWIIGQTTYDTDTAGAGDMAGREYAFNANGVFLQGSAVCEGYAKAYKILCDLSDIPCIIVFGELDGEKHAWNYVRLDGGWYLVDCTSDDPVGSRPVLRWEYFLKGSGGVAGRQTVAAAYTPDEGGYPELSPTDYGAAAWNDGDFEDSLDGSREQAVWGATMRISKALAEGSSAVEPGSVVGTIAADDSAGGYAYQLTGEGLHDTLFQLDPGSGDLIVGDASLSAGTYQVSVRITPSRGNAVTTVIQFQVEPQERQDTPGIQDYEDDKGEEPDSRQGSGRPRWIAGRTAAS